MKSLLKKTLVFLMTFSMLLGCLPQVFAAEGYAVEDRFRFSFKDGTYDFVNTGFPEVTIGLRDENGTLISTTKTKEDGSFKFTGLSQAYDVMSYGILGDQPYRIVHTQDYSEIPGNNHDFIFVAAWNNNTSDAGISKSVVLIEEMYGDLTFTKSQTGDSSIKVKDATYEFFYLGTNDYPITAKSIGSYTTDANGIIKLNGLLCGNYSYKEITSPNSHFLNTTEGNFVINEKTITNVSTSDEAVCSVVLTKVDKDDNNKLLSGVTFELYNKTTNEKINSYKTVNGEITVGNLHYGDYYFIETKAIDGYELDATKYEFSLSGTHTTHNIIAENTPWPLISFQKVDKDTGSEITNAEFSIFTEEGVLVKDGLSGANFSIKLAPGNYYIKEKVTPENYKTMSNFPFTVQSQTNASYKLENEMYKTNVLISKFIKGTENYLSGAKFELIGPRTNLNWTTTNDGFAITNLVPGTYTLRETVTPDGYIGTTDATIVIGNNCETVTVIQDGNTKEAGIKGEYRTINVFNTPINLNINKLDSESEKAIIGAEFTLMKFNETTREYDVFDTFITNGSTYKKSAIPTGDYLLVETKIPTGYQFGGIKNYTGLTNVSVKNNGIYFTITNVEDNELNVYNDRIYGSITINKFGKEFESVTEKNIISNFTEFWFNLSQNRPLAGAKFALFAAEDIKDPCGDGTILIPANTQIGNEITTSMLGNVKFNNLLYGRYKVVETYAPNGYVKTTDNIEITINETNKNVSRDVINQNETIEITVTKKDAITNEMLGNAVYGIYSVEENGLITRNTLIGTIKTDSTGTGTFKSCIPKGNYIVKELIAPDGYVLSDETKSIDFSTPTGQLKNKYSFEFKNNPITLEISKVDAEDTNAYVVSAKMQLIDKKTNSVFKEWTTTNSKYIITAIPAGDYILHEISSPTGYEIAEDKEFTVLAQQVNTVEMQDKRVKGSITVTKTEANSNHPISGVKFQLKNGNAVLEERVTDINGKVQFINLPVATYSNGVITDNMTYTIEEVSAPDGYIILTETTDVVFDLANNINEEINKEISIKNDYTKLEISKIDTETKNKIAGATLSIYKSSDFTDGQLNENATPIKTWVSSDKEPCVINKLPIGNYVLVEEIAPEGYIKTKNIKFELNSAGLVIIAMEDDFTKVEFSKIDETTRNKLAGAVLELYKEEDFINNQIKENTNPIDTWTTSNLSNHRIDRLPVGNYVLIETVAPDGYIKANPLLFSVNATTDIQTVELVNKYTKVDISKLESSSQTKFVEGATLKLYKAEDVNIDGTVKENAEIVDSWISDNSAHRINRLPVGNYVLIETAAPDGYVRSENITFTVRETLQVQNFEMYDDYTKVKFTKFEEGIDKKLLSGAHLVIYNEKDVNPDGTVKNNAIPYQSWVSSNLESHIIYKMPAGNYVLKEIQAPNGYVLAKDIPFTVFAVGNIQEVEMTNEYTKVEISKIDITTKEFVENAFIALYRAEDVNQDGTIKDNAVAAEKWTTTKESHKIYRLPVGDYVLIEQIVPNGYVRAENLNITVQATANIQKFEMEDDYIKVDISKIEKGSDKFVIGSTLGIFKPEDINPDGTVKENTTPISQWNTTNKSHRIDRLYAGNYVLVEMAVPDGYVKAENIQFTVNPVNNIQSFVMEDDYIKLDIIKTDITTKELIAGAELSLYKAEDINIDGTVKENAVAFDNWVSTTSAYRINKIPAGKYVLIENKAPSGYVKSENIAFDVLAVETVQKIDIKNDYTKVDISKVELGSDNTILEGAEFTVYESKYINPDGTVKENAEIVDSWTSDNSAHRINRLPIGNYTVVETKAPNGYVKSKNVQFTVSESTDVLDVKIRNDYIKIEISKVDAETKDKIAGAELTLYRAEDINADGTVKEGAIAVEKWTSTESAHKINKIAVGDYVLIETSSPSGYIKAENVNISVKETDKIQSFTMEDDFTKIEITKTDVETGKILEGAQLQLVDENGNIVEEWISTTSAHRINRLPVGTYKIVEISAPEGYLLNTTEVVISVKLIKDVQTFDVDNELDDYDVTISKIDATTKKELVGAKLVVTDKNGKVIDEWISTNEPHIIKGMLPGVYILTETTSPNGYYIAESITFELLKDGKTVNTQIVMENDYTKVSINKIKKGTDEFVVGAELHIEDKDGNIVVEKWTTENNAKIIYGLPIGHYVLIEDKAPNGYLMSENVEFEVTENGDIVFVTMEDEFIEEKVPESPQTGDNSNITFYFFTMIASLVCLVVLFVTKKKTKNSI